LSLRRVLSELGTNKGRARWLKASGGQSQGTEMADKSLWLVSERGRGPVFMRFAQKETDAAGASWRTRIPALTGQRRLQVSSGGEGFFANPAV